MKFQRYQTRKSIWQRALENPWLVTFIGLALFFGAIGLAEAACQAIGAGYDPRIGAP